MIESWFLEPLGAGAVVFLAVLLGVSALLALLHMGRVRSADDFLIVGHKAKWYDLLASQVGYYMSMAAGVALIPALTYEFGPIAILLVMGYFISAIASYWMLLSSTKVQSYLTAGNYGLPGFISSGFPTGTGGAAIGSFVAIVMAFIYWGLFGVEIVVLGNVFEVVFPGQPTFSIVLVVSVIVVAYASLGGLLGTMRTDGLQTVILIVIILYFTFAHIPNDYVSILLSRDVFQVRDGVPLGNVIGLGLSAVLLGIGYLIPQQDAWSRVSAVSRHESPSRSRWILMLSLLALIPSAAIGLWGLFMFSIDPGLSSAKEIETIPGLVIKHLSGKAPVGLLIPCFVAVAISTADTALLTCTQAIATLNRRWVNSVRKCRVWTAIFGLSGILIAVCSPRVVDAIFGLGAIPLAFIPLILWVALGKKATKTWPAVAILIWGVGMGIVIIVVGGEFRNFGPVILLVVACVLYPVLQAIQVRRKK